MRVRAEMCVCTCVCKENVRCVRLCIWMLGSPVKIPVLPLLVMLSGPVQLTGSYNQVIYGQSAGDSGKVRCKVNTERYNARKDAGEMCVSLRKSTHT